MRWLFHDPANRAEAQYVARQLKAIDAWWAVFRTRTDDMDALFSNAKQWDLPQFMEDHLQKIHPKIMWEFGSAVHVEGHRLAMTPEGERWLRPLVEAVVARAPQIPGWEFYAFRIPDNPENVPAVIAGRTGLETDELRLALSRDDAGRVDVVMYFATDERDEDALLNAAFVGCESLFGESRLDYRIGAIEGRVLSDDAARRLLTPEEAVAVMNELIGEIEQELPDLPCSAETAEDRYSLLTVGNPEELAEQEADDYPYRTDLFTLIASRQDVASASLSNRTFHSPNFSKHGETFAYLKVDGAEGLENSKFSDRGDIEEAVDAALRAANLGCVIGGGTGIRYSYADLALTDIKAAAPVIRQTLLAGGIPQRTWLMFFDDALAAEWYGIHPDTPEPPGILPLEEDEEDE